TTTLTTTALVDVFGPNTIHDGWELSPAVACAFTPSNADPTARLHTSTCTDSAKSVAYTTADGFFQYPVDDGKASTVPGPKIAAFAFWKVGGAQELGETGNKRNPAMATRYVPAINTDGRALAYVDIRFGVQRLSANSGGVFLYIGDRSMSVADAVQLATPSNQTDMCGAWKLVRFQEFFPVPPQSVKFFTDSDAAVVQKQISATASSVNVRLLGSEVGGKYLRVAERGVGGGNIILLGKVKEVYEGDTSAALLVSRGQAAALG
ncbi:unnamed protein product, partial [Amoebophrya sp. A25]